VVASMVILVMLVFILIVGVAVVMTRMMVIQAFVCISAAPTNRASYQGSCAATDQASNCGSACRSADNRGIPFPPVLALIPGRHGLIIIRPGFLSGAGR
jgi:hypothetical protein